MSLEKDLNALMEAARAGANRTTFLLDELSSIAGQTAMIMQQATEHAHERLSILVNNLDNPHGSPEALGDGQMPHVLRGQPVPARSGPKMPPYPGPHYDHPEDYGYAPNGAAPPPLPRGGSHGQGQT